MILIDSFEYIVTNRYIVASPSLLGEGEENFGKMRPSHALCRNTCQSGLAWYVDVKL